MVALATLAVSAIVLTDGRLSGRGPNTLGYATGASELPLIQLHLSGADVAHFERLYTYIVGPERDPGRYGEENTWRRGQLGYGGQVYDIRLKSHGRIPSDHFELIPGWHYRFISLSIRLEAGKRIHGLNRFKLIVRSGFPNAVSIMSMAKHVGAFVQDHRLVRVRINNWPENLFYFSNVLDYRYLEGFGFGPFRRMSYDFPDSGTPDPDIPIGRTSDHSLIYSGVWPRQFEPEPLQRRFELALAQMEIPESEWEPLFERYAAFNAALSDSAGTVTGPSEFLDPGYMQRYETARYVLGLSGHGYEFGNLRVLLNTANGKFYPAFNRDNLLAELDLSGGRTPEWQINNFGPPGSPYAMPLFHYAATSDRLRQRVYRGIYEFIRATERGDERQTGGAGSSGFDCRSRPFVGGLPFVGEMRPVSATPCRVKFAPSADLFNGTVAASNIESLKTWLEASAPEFSADVAADRVTLTIRPNSMSALRIEALTIGGASGQRPVRVALTDWDGVSGRRLVKTHQTAVHTDGLLDLGELLVDARFFTGVELMRQAAPLDVNVRWIAGLEDVERLQLERRFGLENAEHVVTRTWRYELADTSPARLGEILEHDAVEDTHGFDQQDLTRADQERNRRRRQTRSPRQYELVFTFSRPLPGLQVESIALSFVNSVTGQTVAARRVTTVETPAGEALAPASAFAGGTDLFESWAAAHASLAPRRTGPREITLAPGVYDLQDHLIFPAGYDVVIAGGTELRLGSGVVMQIHGGLTMEGSAGKPITVRPIDASKPFGTVAVLGDGSQRTTIRYVDLTGGSDAWVRGARFSGALSIHYQRDVEVSHVSIHGNHGDGGLSIKYARGLLADSVFTGNMGYQMDLDYFDGVVRGNRLAGSGATDQNASGLDVNGSRLVATGNEFSGFIETGARVGERSDVLFAANTWRDNALAMAVSDLSTVYVHDDNVFSTNNLDVNAFLQKDHFGGGTVVLAGNADPAELSVEMDRLSSIVIVSHAAIERLRPTEIPPAAVVSSLTDLSVVSRR